MRSLVVRLTASIAAGATMVFAACHDESIGGPDQTSSAFIVSKPVARPASAGGAAFSLSGAGGGYVYVSLPPGTVPDGVAVVIRNRTTGASAAAYVSGGGFDPVPVPAGPDETVDLDVRGVNGTSLLTASVRVPSSRPPVVVRTDPGPRKLDVPLNALIVVVFSEPMDPRTLTSSTIRLSSSAGAVSGQVVLGSEGTRAEFSPGQLLQPGTTYTLSLTSDIADASGEHLAPVTLDFTTSASTAVGMSQIAFTGCQDPTVTPPSTSGTCGLFVMNADGTGIRRLSQTLSSEAYDSYPAWSPDGTRLAFSSYRHCALSGRTLAPQGGDCQREVYVMLTDGSNVTRVTNLDADVLEASYPAWSPNGQTIAFVGRRAIPNTQARSYGLYAIDPDGSGLRVLVSSSDTSYGRPSWSPDGTKLAFDVYSYPFSLASYTGIHMMNADGSGVVRLTSGYDGFPAWSPDGGWIAFQRVVGKTCCYPQEVFRVSADGLSEARLTHTQVDSLTGWMNLTPSWSPDGLRIVYKVFRPGGSSASELFVMHADGSGSALLNPGWANLPAWSPFGTVPPSLRSALGSSASSVPAARVAPSRTGAK